MHSTHTARCRQGAHPDVGKGTADGFGTVTAALCRNCGAPLRTTFVDLGVSPLANSYILPERAGEPEPFYPLHAFVCERCLLVQLEAFATPEDIFSDYAYFSSYSDIWLEHSRRFAATAIDRLDLGQGDLVIEAASNDGYLLQYFKAAGQRVLGIEPAANVADAARERGVPTKAVFLGKETGKRLRLAFGGASLVIANNVIGHVPDLHDFVGGLESLVSDGGAISVEIPHLLHLIEDVQFDTIYHEHFSYFSLHAMEDVLRRQGLRLYDVEKLPTHGGSLRYWIVRESDPRAALPGVARIRSEETQFGLDRLSAYERFGSSVARRKRGVLEFFLRAAEEGKTVAGYGAPAKGNTLLNYCGIRPDMLAYTVDRSAAKQGTLLPGTRIPVYAPERLAQTKPDYVFILPWNIREEVMEQMAFVRDWGARFAVGTPEIEIV